MTAFDSELDNTIDLLLQDVRRSVGVEYEPAVRELAERVRLLEISDASEKCVDDVQQFFHDSSVDTTWPACPRHRNHPLVYRDGAWHCPHDGARIASLGELAPTSKPAD